MNTGVFDKNGKHIEMNELIAIVDAFKYGTERKVRLLNLRVFLSKKFPKVSVHQIDKIGNLLVNFGYSINDIGDYFTEYSCESFDDFIDMVIHIIVTSIGYSIDKNAFLYFDADDLRIASHCRYNKRNGKLYVEDKIVNNDDELEVALKPTVDYLNESIEEKINN